MADRGLARYRCGFAGEPRRSSEAVRVRWPTDVSACGGVMDRRTDAAATGEGVEDALFICEAKG